MPKNIFLIYFGVRTSIQMPGALVAAGEAWAAEAVMCAAVEEGVCAQVVREASVDRKSVV